MYKSQSNLEEKVNPSILKDGFPSRTDPSIFTSIAPVLLDRSNASTEIKATCPSPQCLVDQIQVQKPITVVATAQMFDHT